MIESNLQIKKSLNSKSDIQHNEILDQLYSSRTNYIQFLEEGDQAKIWNLSIPFEEAQLSALNAAFEVSTINSLSGYSLGNTFIQEFQYTIKNTIMHPYTRFLNLLAENLKQEVINSHINYTILIIIICLIFVLSFVVLFATSALAERAVQRQSKMLLSVRPKKYRKMKLDTLEFIEVWFHNSSDLSEEEKSQLDRYSTKSSLYKRNFSSAAYCLGRKFILHVGITIIVIGGLIIGMSLSSDTYYKQLSQIRDAFNNSARIDQVFMFLDSALL